MKAYVTNVPGDIVSLAMTDLPTPALSGPGAVRVSIGAASVNYRDLLMLRGYAGIAKAADLIPLSDGAGVVTEVGEKVWRVKPGDRVAITFNPDWLGGDWFPSPGSGGRGGALPGVMCEELVVDQNELVVLPDYLDLAEGATLPCAAVTAWNALCAGQLQPGMSVLLQGGGGVSVFALQFARLFGARVVMVSSSAERCARLTELGAHDTIDRSAVPAWADAVRTVTGGGADVVVDVGGASTIEQSLAAVRPGGRIATVGLLGGPPASLPNLFMARARIDPVTVGNRADLEGIVRAMAFHRTRPVIASRHSFDELPQALAELEEGRHIGKIVLTKE